MNLLHNLSKARVLCKAKILKNGIKVFWWTGKKNFGDLLTPELFAHYGYTPIYAPIDCADVIGVGSLINMLPSDYSGTILGSGLIDDTVARFDKAKFVTVRGELTKKNLGLPLDTPTGDMGLLARGLLKKNSAKKKFSIGIIPHFVDKNNPWILDKKKELGSNGCIIDVQDTARRVVECISMCDLIASSSLHGIIVADALEIPNVWIELSDKVIGGGFKFRDYNSSINFEQTALKISLTTKLSELETNTSHKDYSRISEKKNQLESLLLETLFSINNETQGL